MANSKSVLSYSILNPGLSKGVTELTESSLRYEYVRLFEQSDELLPNTWIVVRIDGRGFHSLSNRYGFQKPNDVRALNLMNAAAAAVVKEIPDLCIAYGVSDEYSFVFHKTSTLFDRRSSKLLSTILSTFTSFYTYLWPAHFPTTPLQLPYLPTFDARHICYPSLGNLRDYLSWRQVDCHINNLYNTTFWAMRLRGGLGAREVEELLKGSVAGDKNEILWGTYGINYNDEEEMFRKGSVVFREYGPEEPSTRSKTTDAIGAEEEEEAVTAVPAEEPSRTQKENAKKARAKARIVFKHIDIIKNEFWERRPWILSGKPGTPIVAEDSIEHGKDL